MTMAVRGISMMPRVMGMSHMAEIIVLVVSWSVRDTFDLVGLGLVVIGERRRGQTGKQKRDGDCGLHR